MLIIKVREPLEFFLPSIEVHLCIGPPGCPTFEPGKRTTRDPSAETSTLVDIHPSPRPVRFKHDKKLGDDRCRRVIPRPLECKDR